MAQINIQNTATNPYGWTFTVSIQEDNGATKHSVTVAKDYYEKLTGGKITPEELVKFSFDFLLAHEPKESIMSQFGLQLIQKYFADYENSIKFKLADLG